MNDFFKLTNPAEFIALFKHFTPLATERIALDRARDRVLAEALLSPQDLPPFTRSSMDGYAVRAADTFGCSESENAFLHVIGEIAMGTPGHVLSLKPGQAARIWTGGALPDRADAVVMLEYTQNLDQKTVAVFRPVAPEENTIRAGEDYGAGSVILDQGRRLRPQDLGILSGLGITTVPVYRKPRVAILSTGDELVPPGQTPPPGAIRDINSTTLAALVEEAGGIALPMGICTDDFEQLLARCQDGIAQADVLLLSGGSSVGQRDFTRQVFAAISGSELLVHGVSVRPGKPTILARLGNKAFFGLPGHVASALVVFTCFVRPLLRQYSGLGPTLGLHTCRALTGQQIPSVIGREDYVRIRLLPQDDSHALPLAMPIYGKSGLLKPLVQADGLLPIDRDVEGLDRGVEVSILLFP